MNPTWRLGFSNKGWPELMCPFFPSRPQTYTAEEPLAKKDLFSLKNYQVKANTCFIFCMLILPPPPVVILGSELKVCQPPQEQCDQFAHNPKAYSPSKASDSVPCAIEISAQVISKMTSTCNHTCLGSCPREQHLCHGTISCKHTFPNCQVPSPKTLWKHQCKETEEVVELVLPQGRPSSRNKHDEDIVCCKLLGQLV